LISLRKQIEESEQIAVRFQALLKVLRALTAFLPNAALPANSEIFTHGEALQRLSTLAESARKAYEGCHDILEAHERDHGCT
jgi:hypothetical protein